MPRARVLLTIALLMFSVSNVVAQEPTTTDLLFKAIGELKKLAEQNKLIADRLDKLEDVKGLIEIEVLSGRAETGDIIKPKKKHPVERSWLLPKGAIAVIPVLTGWELRYAKEDEHNFGVGSVNVSVQWNQGDSTAVVEVVFEFGDKSGENWLGWAEYSLLVIKRT